MECAKGDNADLSERDEIDVVSAWLLKLAIGMMALGVLFAVLDEYHFFQAPTEPPQPHLAVAA
jgi:hypothetical protein